MEFDAVVRGEEYRFTSLNDHSVLVSGQHGDYILYKKKVWRCADDVSVEMVEELGKSIDHYMRHGVRHEERP